jgi:hypothetical protein
LNWSARKKNSKYLIFFMLWTRVFSNEGFGM